MIINIKNLKKSKKRIFRIYRHDLCHRGKIDTIGFDDNNIYRMCHYGYIEPEPCIIDPNNLVVKDFYYIKKPIKNGMSKIISGITGGTHYIQEPPEEQPEKFVGLDFELKKDIPWDSTVVNFLINKSNKVKNIGGGENIFLQLERLNEMYGDEYLEILSPLLLGVSLFSTLMPMKLYFYMNSKDNSIDFKRIELVDSGFLGNYLTEKSIEDVKRFISLLSCGCYPNFKRKSDLYNKHSIIMGYIGFTEAKLRIKKGLETMDMYFNLSDHFRLLRYIVYFDDMTDNIEFWKVANRLEFNSLAALATDINLKPYHSNCDFINDVKSKFYETEIEI